MKIFLPIMLTAFTVLNGFGGAAPTDPGKTVVVVYNTLVPESKDVAQYYAQKRQVPGSQVLGFALPKDESMTRQDYLSKLQEPLARAFESNHWFTFGPMPKDAPPALKDARRVVDASVRYVVLCYGVPTKIARDPKFVEPAENTYPQALRRNEASVDSQLAVLPALEQKPDWVGPLRNPVYSATNASALHPVNSVLMVCRLDGPFATIARGLVDKAMDAETNGLWGRGYFDARGLTAGDYLVGDEWIRKAADMTRSAGFETELDTAASTFPASHPMSQIAFYAGWYDENISGPLALPEVEFMPGAFAYHLHSFNAATIRSASARWVGPLLAKGVTCTLGSVEEPYLQMTPDLSVFFHRFIWLGFSFGEASYACQAVLSWQNIAIGDPLYRPFAKNPKAVHDELVARSSSQLDWSVLRWVNLNLAQPDPNLPKWINYLEVEALPFTRTSPVLKEKLADMYLATKKITDSLETYQLVLKLNPSRQQKLRVLLILAQKYSLYGPDDSTLKAYQQIMKEYPDYPGLLEVCRKALPLAQRFGPKEAIESIEREIKRLSPVPPNGTAKS